MDVGCYNVSHRMARLDTHTQSLSGISITTPSDLENLLPGVCVNAMSFSLNDFTILFRSHSFLWSY